MKTIVAWITLVLTVIGLGVAVEVAVGVPDPFPTPNGSVEGGLSQAYVDTPISFNDEVQVTDDASVVRILRAFVIGLPPGLSAVILAVRPGDYCLQAEGFPGDPRTYRKADLMPMSAVRLSHGEYGEFILVLTAHRLGTFHTSGIALDWSSEGYTGEERDPFGITIRVNETGRDPELLSPDNPFGPNLKECAA